MPTLAQVRSRVDDKLAQLWGVIVSRQETHYANHGRYWQGLVTHVAAPSHTTATYQDAQPDRLDERPTDVAQGWRDALPEIDGVAVPMALVIDDYVGPEGAGFVATVWACCNTVTYSRSQNYGPETWRTVGWHVVESEQ